MQQPQLLEQLVTAVITLDQRGHIRFANAAAESLLSGSSRRLQGAPLESLLRYSSIDFQLLHEAFKSQQSLSDSDVVWVLHDGKQMTVELMVSPCNLVDGQPGQLLELRQVDLIRRLNQEQAQQHQLAAAQQLIRGLAHEIKNPLGGIRGAAQLLDAKLANPEQEEYTQLIIKQADRLRALVDRLLGPNKPGTRATVNVHQLIERSIQLVTLDSNQHIAVERDYDPSLPDIEIVEHQVEQVVLNILQNAVEAMVGQSQPELIVRTRVAHQETIYGTRYRQCLVINLIDNGPGVDAQLRDTLFYPLVSGREGGSGLGLSIAQSLVHQHAGKIELNSRPGKTDFTLYLPYTRAI
ncbi:nitrogen regulation protein NR(II) [Aliidiomarina maris]|uniref:Sensory histidine kinase/phosphatase NtrB n=1 Tax=Aliidiomarina maris TaxID=531312 RepID=A0A327WUU7_9GAMM|nr:nitrogen regulation protein NR(II) [Aliidiomarina maris]RAJ96348.1 PAS/PAC sensor signal transduction histidine kinase [Aliidiomarina maris]RUO22874.1 nitrogen regulation protein NR(II) [Aliidiomarina maris]